ncbi:MAG: septal ring lytic transglycosylase RlpA family protein [Maricaulaceae bacterium]
MVRHIAIAALAALAATGCATAPSDRGHAAARVSQPTRTTVDPVAATPRAKTPDIAPSNSHQKIGRPYQVDGKWYVPARDDDYNETGVASWYGPNFAGRPTANGERFDPSLNTAAHPTLPLPSYVRVTNLENGREIVTRVNDRGPFLRNRIIDLSRAAAEALDYINQGVAKVRVQYLGPAPALNAPSPRTLVRAPASAERGDWYVQAGAFRSEDNARSFGRTVRKAGPTQVRRASDGRRLYRVLLGPWDERAEAEAARSRLAQLGHGGVVTQTF